MEIDYGTELLTETPDNVNDDPPTAANPFLLVVTHVNKRFYLMLIKVTELYAPSSSKLWFPLLTFLKNNTILKYQYN